MARISGDMAGIEKAIRSLVAKKKSVWAEVTYTGEEQPGDIQKELSELVKDSAVEILSIIDAGKYQTADNYAGEFGGKTLGMIEPLKMLERLMNSKGTPKDRQEKMKELCAEILQEISAEEK